MPSLPALRPPVGFSRYRRRAERKAKSPKRTRSVAVRAMAKYQSLKPQLRALRQDLPILIRLTKAWATGDYRRIPFKGVISVIAAVLYFLNPYDLIPDFIPFIGYLDDAAVVAYVMRLLHDEITLFVAWEEEETLT